MGGRRARAAVVGGRGNGLASRSPLLQREGQRGGGGKGSGRVALTRGVAVTCFGRVGVGVGTLAARLWCCCCPCVAEAVAPALVFHLGQVNEWQAKANAAGKELKAARGQLARKEAEHKQVRALSARGEEAEEHKHESANARLGGAVLRFFPTACAAALTFAATSRRQHAQPRCQRLRRSVTARIVRARSHAGAGDGAAGGAGRRRRAALRGGGGGAGAAAGRAAGGGARG